MGAQAECLRQPHVKHLVTSNIVGRLPNGMGPLVVALFLRSQGFEYGAVGALAALYGVAAAVGGPFLGRFVDLYGQVKVLLVSAAASTTGFFVLAGTSSEQAVPAAVAIALAGSFTPPLEPCLRSLWPAVLDGPRAVNAAYALDAALQEVIFVAGPLLVVAFVNGLGTPGAVIMTGLVALLGTAVFVAAPPVRQWRPEVREADWAGPLRSGTLRMLLFGFLFVGGTLGMLNIAVVAYGEEMRSTAVSGLVLGANALGALAGGLVYGSRSWSGAARVRLRWLMLGLALACAFVVVGDSVPTGTTTEAFAWLVTIFMMGNALGTSVSGAVLENWGLAAAFAAPAVSAFLGCSVFLVSRAFRSSAQPESEGAAS